MNWKKRNGKGEVALKSYKVKLKDGVNLTEYKKCWKVKKKKMNSKYKIFIYKI